MILISTLADGMLSAALLVLWLVQRDGRLVEVGLGRFVGATASRPPPAAA